MDKPAELQDELDELRNRGIAKLLNRHFTETTKRVAEEKAAVDAALQDLEERRARTSEFVPSKGGELNPFDSLYVELQQKKAESRRKERETLLLYQRYVQKFGNTGLVVAPDVSNKAKTEKDSSPQNSQDSGSTPPPAPPPPEIAPETDIYPETFPTENVPETSSKANVVPPEFHHKQLAERDTSTPKVDNAEETASPAEDVPTETEEVVENVSEDLAIEGNNPAGMDDNLREAAPSTSRGSLQENVEAQSADVKQESPKIDDEPVPVAQSSPSVPTLVPQKYEIANKTNLLSKVEVEDGNCDPTAESIPSAQNPSGLASLPNTSAVQDDTAPAAKELPKPSPDKSESEASDGRRPTREVSTEVPLAAAASDDDSIRSIISGLTSINSAVTRQVLDEVETQLETFIKTETDAIRRIMSEEDKSHTSSLENSSGSFLGNESQACTLKAEAMARQMQAILDDFGKDPSVANIADETDDASLKKSEYPRKYITANESEEWMVHYDERYQREYYYETHSNRTQWEPPASKTDAETVESDLLSHVDVRPESHRLRSSFSRRSVYRKKMRRKRMRRLVVLLFFFFVAACAGLYWKQYHPEKSLQQVSTLMVENLKSIEFEELKQYAIDQYEYTFTDRRAREEADHQQELKKMAAQREREEKAKEESERRARQEVERLAAEEQRRQQKIAAELKVKEERRRRELEEAKQEEFKRLMRSVENERALKESEARRRPWGCNIPLAYVVHGRCRRLASLNPMYNERDVVHSFLQ